MALLTLPFALIVAVCMGLAYRREKSGCLSRYHTHDG